MLRSAWVSLGRMDLRRRDSKERASKMEAQGERMRWADVSEGCHAVRTFLYGNVCVCVYVCV